MADPALLIEARRWIGQKERPGAAVNPWIIDLWYRAAPWLAGNKPADDSTVPWCGAFLRMIAVNCGHRPAAKWWSARAWLEWGVRIDYPIPGAVVVFDGGSRGAGAGHVAVVDGQDDAGRLLCVGGNQGDAVTLAAFSRDRVLGYRLPPGSVVPALALLPVRVAARSLATSTREG